MNTLHHIASLGFALLLLASACALHADRLLVPISLAQVPSDGVTLPEGIEATGDTAEVRALTAWADEYRQTYPQQARQASERALSLARELNDQRGIGQSSIILGNLVFTSEHLRAETHYTVAQEAFEQIRDEHGLNHSLLGMGNVYGHRGEAEQALTYYFAALKGFERLGDTEGRAATLNGIGVEHQSQGNLEESLVAYEQAAMLAETLDEPILLVSIFINFGFALAEQGSYEQAESTLRRALAISKEHGYQRYTIAIANNLGYLFNHQARYEQALPFLFTAERLSKELRKDVFLSAVYDELGKAYLGLGHYDLALRYGNESLALAEEMESLSQQMIAHQTLSEIYTAAGNHEQALIHYRQYAAARDSAFTVEKAEIVTEMQTRYETEEKRRAIERLEHENQIWLILLLTGMGGLLLLLGFLFYRYRVKQKANRLLEELDEAKSHFFANISHEFRTPLTVILGELQDGLAGRFGALSEKLTRQHQAMLRNTQQLQRLVDEVLDLNRLEVGRLELKPTPGNLVRSLRQFIEADAPLAERNDIELTFEHDVEHCPRLYDKEKLEKIAGNLLSNALKFTPKGGSVQVELRCGSETEISVSDDGPGIPVEMQHKVFERFAQLEDGSLHGGTGIGLALAKELAELHDGTITLESEPGEGSTFTVRLPLETISVDDLGTENVGASRVYDPAPGGGETPLPQATAPTPPEEFEVGGNGAAPSGQPDAAEAGTSEEPDRTTVLVIEDNDDVRAYVRRSLEETFRVIEADDGEGGLQQAREALPDLIVSDVMLPGIDGYEVARRLKTELATECIPVVMLTARAAEEDQAEGYGSGAEVYITKPFSPEILHAAIARLLEERLRLRRRLREETGEAEEQEQKNGYPTLRNRARATVLDNLYDEDFGVEELASALNMTRFTLYHRFKSEVGASPSTFVKALRMERARKLLSNGAGSVSEVAYAVGFNSLVAFSRAYSAHYGTPPSGHLVHSGGTPE